MEVEEDSVDGDGIGVGGCAKRVETMCKALRVGKRLVVECTRCSRTG